MNSNFRNVTLAQPYPVVEEIPVEKSKILEFWKKPLEEGCLKKSGSGPSSRIEHANFASNSKGPGG